MSYSDLKTLSALLRTTSKAKNRAEILSQHASQYSELIQQPLLAERFGQLVIRHLYKAPKLPQGLKILLLGQCTTTWLRNYLITANLHEHRLCYIHEGAYDNILQELHAPALLNDPPDIVILLPWRKSLQYTQITDPAQYIQETLQFWQQCWQLILKQGHSKLLQTGYDWTQYGTSGFFLSNEKGEAGIARTLNQKLREHLPEGACFLDLEQLSSLKGKAHFYDPRRYHWTRQPFSETGCLQLAHTLVAGIRTLTNGSRKVLVVDLDNTLWGGVIGETGALGIELGDSPEGTAYRTFQAYLKALSQRGIILAVASKNNLQDACEAFEKNPEMILKKSDFAAFEASWQPKALALQTIAASLRLGTDALVFFDDNPAERAHIRATLPEVAVVDVSTDPSEFINDLEQGMWFESITLTTEDHLRNTQYQQEHQRKALQQTVPDLNAYLASLEMEACIQTFNPQNLPRIVQLVAKTNQFNVTSKRHGFEHIKLISEHPEHIGLSLHVRDKFGDYGLVSVLIATPHPECPKTLDIDTWLMSCRVIGRTTEHFMINHFIAITEKKGYQKITSTYLPSSKNALVSELFSDMGFCILSETESGTKNYILDINSWQTQTTFLKAQTWL